MTIYDNEELLDCQDMLNRADQIDEPPKYKVYDYLCSCDLQVERYEMAARFLNTT